MYSSVKQFMHNFFERNKEEQLKLVLLGIAFLFVIGAYTLVRELKSSLFMSIVGKEYVPWARMSAMIFLIPAILVYSLLVDRLKQYQLLFIYSLLYGIMGLWCAYLIGHPLIGLPNTVQSPYRLFGWLFYFFIEGCSPFVVSVFWSFVNSVYTPEAAKHNYPWLVACSKVGGMLSAGFAWTILSYKSVWFFALNDIGGHQVLLYIFSFCMFCVSLVIWLLIKIVPQKHLHGYEAVYQFEKRHKKEQKLGMFTGLTMLVRFPYILGIFGMIFFYEIVNTVLSYHRLGVAQGSASDVAGISAFLFEVAFFQHLFGLIISCLGTKTLLEFFGERVCLMLVPAISALLLIYFTISYTNWAVLIGLILLQAINYAFAQPVRESLYIPTVTNIRFKCKSWIDAFGSRFARGVGSTFIVMSEFAGAELFFAVHSLFFTLVIACWFLTAFLLGKRYMRAIAHNEVIGLEAEL